MSQQTSQSNLQLVNSMQSATFRGDWDGLGSYLTEDIIFKIGSVSEIVGLKPVVAYLREVLPSKLELTGANVRGAWEIEDVAVVEMDVQGVVARDSKTIQYPAVDVFRFRGAKIREWRIYPVHSLFTE